MKYRAELKPRRRLFIGQVLLLLLAVWAVRHVYAIESLASGHSQSFELIYALAFGLLAWQTLLYCLERPYTASRRQQARLDYLRTVVNVPVCNEDKTALAECLASIFQQSRKADIVHVVVNGPNKVDYSRLKQRVLAYAAANGHELHWTEQAVAGKRQAQATTARRFLQPGDIFVTIDSDAYLDREAIREGLKPFTKPKIMSVAGVVLTANNRAKLLTRLSDLWFLSGQLVDRSAFSSLGAVLVNSGVLAFYRGYIILDNLDGYTNESFFGRPVEFSDDSLLTIYALQNGRAVQQPTSFAFTLMPENLDHHVRQQLRWMRGAFIRSWWRFKYLPLSGYAFWGHLIGWCQLFMSSFVFAYLFFWMPLKDHAILPYLLVIPLLVGYGQALRYLTIWRSDESFSYRFKTFLMEPIPALWSFFVLRFLRYYAMATCLKTGWGTRAEVEVSA